MSAEASLDLPRILCLHGGGTNARIFRAQCRVLVRSLPSFRLCFAEAPFAAEPGPDVTSVYKSWGPFRSWLPWRDGAGHVDPQCVRTPQAIVAALKQAIDLDDTAGARGDWVAVLGFSQGAKVGASLMLAQQLSRGAYFPGFQALDIHFRFSILLAGRAPLVPMAPLMAHSLFHPPTELLSLPSIHVHGSQDKNVHLHRHLMDHYCDKETSFLIEWNGGHRVPIKSKDVALLADRIRIVAAQGEALFY